MSEKEINRPPEEIFDEAQGIVEDYASKGENAANTAEEIVKGAYRKSVEADELGNFFKKAQEKGGKRPEIIINKNNDKNKLKGFEKLISKN